ncbi:MAG: amidohydrolase family protein [Chloroflexi bacterium]|nr:amidohydrolase family protein [Chloroflexota bacterium]
MADLVIKNGRVVTSGGLIYGGLAIEGEKIVRVGGDASLPQARRVINAEGNFVVPGLIDPHVHMSSEEDASLEEGIQQNWPVETDGAIHGGVTTLGHFVGKPKAALVPLLEKTISYGERFSRIDFFCHAFVLDQDRLAEYPELCRRGVTSFKHLFNAYKPREGEKLASMLGGPSDEGMLFRSLEFAARYGYPAICMVHCEEIDIIEVLENRLRQAGRTDLLAWTEARPNFTEAMRIVHAMEIAKAVGAPLYIVHISSAEGVDLVTEARRQGHRIWGETGPSWLTHTGEMETEIGGWGKVNPPLRYSRDCERLWRGILDGGITNIGTDHGMGGRTRLKKEGGKGKHNNIWDSRPGIRGGMEHMLPSMMTYGVLAGRISIEDLVRVCSTNTARAFGLYPRKGVLAPGSDADIVLVDPNKEVTIDKDFYHCLCEVSIYGGWKVKGLARTTILRGQVMMEDYETVGAPGKGRYVPCRAY